MDATDTTWLIQNYNKDWITVSKLHFTIPALAAALPELNGHDHSDKYLIPAQHRDRVTAILETSKRIPHRTRDQETADAAQYGLIRDEDLPHNGHPLGHKTGTVIGGTTYNSHLDAGSITLYDRS